MIDWFLENYPDCPPLGYMLRERFSSRWFRIHSLPESKRYPDNSAEEDIIVSRHNQVATDLLGQQSDCQLVVARRMNGDPDSPLPAGYEFSSVGRYDDGEPEPWVVWATNVAWSARAYDDLILAVANEQTYGVLFISPHGGGIYAPYDGGADLLHIDPTRLADIKRKYHDWASKRPDGL